MFYSNYLRLCNNLPPNGKSPSAVASELGLSKAVITRWAKGATPRGGTLQKVADYFGITVDELLGTPTTETKKDATENGSALDARAVLFKQLNHMSTDELLNVISEATDIIKKRG